MDMIDLLAYLDGALAEIARGGASTELGSHVVGKFTKAAGPFENEVRGYVAELIKACGFQYETDLRSPKLPGFDKLTLGQLIGILEDVRQRNPTAIDAHLHGMNMRWFIESLREVNRIWTATKHADSVDVAEPGLIEQLKGMREMTKVIRRG